MGPPIVIWDRSMNADQCRATVFLHDPLRRSLATWLGGRDVASMQRCALDTGHRGEHVGFPDASGRASFRWDELGFHFGSAEGPDHNPREGSFGSRLEGDDLAGTFAVAPGKSTTRLEGGRHSIDANTVDKPNRRSPTQALWALTAAVEQLTDLISAACDRPNSNSRGEPTAGAHDRGSAALGSHLL
jgi:hypothetical protein